ncbi:lipopolysaccharide biosynthesis protein [Elizabethkingia meningoseptica]|uniref:lipopolysaccharide biosynthesis protein n=1 Tax=Elizabethkingia meningoseptica TaxID=238 RepID=UPI00158FED6D|nr:lipopolysaccharide biosynthesis protein [Elizabethkingia meningoseptica]MEC4712289.1 lipopolysaccharide biosynthesis protein [Elizabethkingia meningoseptica]
MASDKTKTIAKNSIMLYIQMLFSMLVALYTSRVILNVLGVEDFGIYNVVGGVVAMFSILNGAMSNSTGRFLTFALGDQAKNLFNKVFNMALIVHFLIACIICIGAEIIGYWFLEHKLQIPPERMDAAVFAFHCSVFTAFLTIIVVPYTSAIIAYEKMGVFAYFTLIDLLLKLGVVFAIQTIDWDKLKVYAFLLVIAQFIVQLVNFSYCFIKIKDTHIKKIIWDKSLFKEMTSFAGWSMFGDSAFILQNQGLNILINMFFGAAVNAARGIAVQVQGVVSRFIGNFQMAMSPQITKSYASRDFAYFHKLIYASSKYSFFIFLFLAIPILFETNLLLTIWLKVVPEYTVNFVRILLFISLISCLANPLILAVKSTGKIKRYEIILGIVSLSVVPLAYAALKMGYTPEIVYFVHLSVEITGQIIRLKIVAPMIGLSQKKYFTEVILKCIVIMLLAMTLPFIIYESMPESFIRLIFIGVTSTVLVLLLSYFIGMEEGEKQMIKNMIFSKIKINKA